MRDFRDLAQKLAAAAALATLTFAAPMAHADDEEEDTESIVYAQRNIVLATGQLRPEGLLSFSKQRGSDDLFIRVDARAAWAPIKNLEVGALAVPLALSPEVDYGNPRLYARYRLLSGNFEIAPELGFEFNKANVLDIGVPLRWKINKAAYLDIRPKVFIDFPSTEDNDKVTASLGVPIEVAISVMRQLYVSIKTGLFAYQFDFDQAVVPLGLEVGYSLPSAADTAWIDIYLAFAFTDFLNLGPGDAINADNWLIGLGARFHFSLE